MSQSQQADTILELIEIIDQFFEEERREIRQLEATLANRKEIYEKRRKSTLEIVEKFENLAKDCAE